MRRLSSFGSIIESNRPNLEGDLIYALPVQMTGTIALSPWSPWYPACLIDIWHVLVHAHERNGVRVEETEIFFFP
jgi:hypothetical protein